MEESPILGFGSPRENDLFPELPPVGTHGTFWYVLFSHGIPGVVLFSAALAALVVATARPVHRDLLWLHGTVFGGAMLIPFYDLLPVPIFTVMAAAAVIVRDAKVTS